MKKLTKTLPFILAIGLMIQSCSEVVEITDEKEVIDSELNHISATLGSYKYDGTEGTTRSTVITDANNDLQLVWGENDTIGIFPTTGFQVAFPMSGVAGQKSASFDGGGWGLKTESAYSAYYPMIGQFYLDKTKLPIIMKSQKQSGNGSFAHIGETDYMVALNAHVNASGGVDFSFQPLTCMLRMEIKMPKGGKYNYVALETSGKFTTEATYDLTNGELTPVHQSPLQVMKLENVELDNNEETPISDIYLTMLPVDMTGLTICAKIFDEDGVCYTTNMTGKEFVAGTIYPYRKIATIDMTHTGLPVVLINTPDNQNITSKEEYVTNTLVSVLQTDIMDEFCELTNIKGRGNSTWTCPKKPYALKFNDKKSLLSLPKDKQWVLLANYYDATLLRNDLALYMGNELSNLDWTPHFSSVDLTLNGEYKGIYQLGEKVKTGKNRVNVDGSQEGFLMEIDNRATSEEDARYFYVNHISAPINIKDPDVEYDDENFQYAKAFFEEADAALFGSEYKDVENGWQKYLDVNSFVDWYLINEIAKNTDACIFHSSCYVNLKRGGKLKMGPLWDFDVAFANYNFGNGYDAIANNPEGFWLKNVSWYSRLFTDPVFVNAVKERFNHFYSNRQVLMDHIDNVASSLVEKVQFDNQLWGTITDQDASADVVQDAYMGKVAELKTWLSSRLEWLNTNINALTVND